MEFCFVVLSLLFNSIITQVTSLTSTATTQAQTTRAPCSSNFCLNNGVCVWVTDKNICACPEGVTGRYCETVLDLTSHAPLTTTLTTTTTTTPLTTSTQAPTTTKSPCTNTYCLNNGICVDVLGKPVCACPEGSTGTHCEITACPPDYCINQGVCVVVVGKPICACPHDLTGTHCEITSTTTTTTSSPTTPSNTACSNNPCMSGGSCLPLSGGRFECKCPPGYDLPICLPGATQTAASTITSSTIPTTITSSTIPTTITSSTIPTTTTSQQCDTSVFDGCEKAEVVFMITYSRYDSSSDIDHEGDFVKELIEKYTQLANVRVGLVVYHDSVRESIHITDYAGDKAGLLNRVDTLTTQRRHYLTPSGEPDVARALTFVRDNSFKGARPGAKKVVIPILHHVGIHCTAMEDAANSLKQECVQIFVQAVERPWFHICGNIVARIATSPNPPYYYIYRHFNNLEEGGRIFHLSQSC